MRKLIKKLVPRLEKLFKWVICMAFEVFKLTGLAYMVMHLITATFFIEVAITAIVVYSSLYFTINKE